jgi:hypothetical protein
MSVTLRPLPPLSRSPAETPPLAKNWMSANPSGPKPRDCAKKTACWPPLRQPTCRFISKVTGSGLSTGGGIDEDGATGRILGCKVVRGSAQNVDFNCWRQLLKSLGALGKAFALAALRGHVQLPGAGRCDSTSKPPDASA